MSPKKDSVGKKAPKDPSTLPTANGDPGGLPPPEDRKTNSTTKTTVNTDGDPGGLPPPEDSNTN